MSDLLPRPSDLSLSFTHCPINGPAPTPGALILRVIHTVVIIHAPQDQVVVPVCVRYAILIGIRHHGNWQVLYGGGRDLTTARILFPFIANNFPVACSASTIVISAAARSGDTFLLRRIFVISQFPKQLIGARPLPTKRGISPGNSSRPAMLPARGPLPAAGWEGTSHWIRVGLPVAALVCQSQFTDMRQGNQQQTGRTQGQGQA